VKNAFNEWQVFCDFDMQKSITNLENEESIKYMVDMLYSFVLQVAKEDGSLYLPTKYCFLFKFLNCILLSFVCKKG
jgi:hypothetical protein